MLQPLALKPRMGRTWAGGPTRMDITLIGVVVFAIGLLLLRYGTSAMLAFTFVCILFGGSATIKLTAIGNTSIQPSILATFFLALRCLWPGPGRAALFGNAVRSHIALIVFVGYGLLSAIFLPRIFAGTIEVTPLRPLPTHFIYAVYPLKQTTQNLTVSVYLITTLLGGISAYIASAQQDAPRVLARTIVWCAFAHATFGYLSVIGHGTPIDLFFAFIRNGSYAQLDQDVGGIVRMAGVLPEPSIFCLIGLIFFAFVAELWLRGVDRPWSGAVAAYLLAALLLSTSTTAYVGVLAWSGLMAVRVLLFPNSIPFSKYLAVGVCLSIVVIAISLLLLVDPGLADKAGDVLSRVTFNKLDSRSGRQRLFFAQQGLSAFVHTGGLGIGAGSFRSSGLLAAIAGSMGIIGLLSFLTHWAGAIGPMRRSTYIATADLRADVGAAASWAALLMIFPMSLSWPTPDPGVLWGLMCGAALGLRAQVTQQAMMPTPVPYPLR